MLKTEKLVAIRNLGGRLAESEKPMENETGYICTISTAALNKNGNRIERCAVDYTGETLLFSDALGNVFVAHIYKNRFLAIATNSRAYCLQFLDHNKLMFAIATYDRNVKVVNSSGKLEETLKGHTKKVTRIEVNYTKQLFFTMSKDCINLWNLKNFRRVRSLYPKKDGFIDAVFSKDGDHLISRFEVRDCLTKNGLLYYWNLVTYEMEREVHSHSDRENMAVLADEKQIIFAGSSTTLHHLNLEVSELSTLSLPLHNTSCTKVLPVPLPGSSRTFALLCDDHRVHVVDIDRVNSVVCCLASKTKKYVDFWMDSCGNLLCGLTNEGDVELFRTKTLINFEFS